MFPSVPIRVQQQMHATIARNEQHTRDTNTSPDCQVAELGATGPHESAVGITHTLGFLTATFQRSFAAKLVRLITRSSDGPISSKDTFGICSML